MTNTTTTTPMAYIGHASCGCVRAIIVDEPERKREVAKETAKWIRSGLTIERMTVEEARPLIKRCPHREQGQ